MTLFLPGRKLRHVLLATAARRKYQTRACPTPTQHQRATFTHFHNYLVDNARETRSHTAGRASELLRCLRYVKGLARDHSAEELPTAFALVIETFQCQF